MQVGWVSAVQDRRVASFRYRVEAPTAGLRARGHEVEVWDLSKADSYDVVVFSKAYSAEHRAMARAVKKRGGRVVFDLCDNHFYNPFNLPKYRRARDEIGEMMSIADRVICSTPALAKVVREEMDWAFEPIVIGDVVERYQPEKEATGDDLPLRLTWFGSHGSPNAPSGMTDLLLIRDELEALAEQHPVELTVCSNSREKFDQAIAQFRLQTRYVEWSLDAMPRVLAESDAAVLPMNINPFTACKTHNRLTTALYAGVPVIAAGIESYKEFGAFCTLDDWSRGFQSVLEGRESERARALSSRAHIDRRWSLDTLSVRWEAALALSSRYAGEGGRLHGVRLHGRLDAVARGAVTGWVRPAAQGDVSLQVVLEYDGEPISIATADRPRDDLKEAGLPADCGFSLALPPKMAGAGASRLTVRVLDTDWVVGENPILVGDNERPSFAPASAASGLARRQGAGHEQRWDVAEAVELQERMLEELKVQKAAERRVRAEAARTAVLGSATRPAAKPGAPITFKDMIRGADSPL